MRSIRSKKIFAAVATFCLVATQLLVISSYLLKPKPAQAFWGIGDFNFSTKIADIYDIAKDIGLAAAYRIGLNYSNQYLTRFVNQVLDKYKIRNYLYYDKVLTNWYMNQYIYDKVADPDLRAIYTLLQRTYITGESTGYTGGIDQRKALIPRIRAAIAKQYTNNGGIDSQKIYNPGTDVTDREYFATAQAYFSNPPSFTEQQVLGEFAAAQGAASAAAGQEQDAGGGFKAGRSTKTSTGTDSNGVTFSQVISAIENPASFVQDFTNETLKIIFENNYGVDPNNLWSAVGSLLGNFIFNKLSLNTSSGVWNEYGDTYKDTSSNSYNTKDIDLDADGIPDGQDSNNDNIPDSCYHGGVTPNCTPSRQASNTPYFVPLCGALDQAITDITSYNAFINTYTSHFKDDQHFENEADSDVWVRKSSIASNAIDNIVNSIENYHISYLDPIEINVGRYSNFMSSVVASLAKDHDLDLSLNPLSFGGGGLSALKSNTQSILDYLIRVKNELGSCSAPNTQAAGQVSPPVILDPPVDDSGGGGFVECDNPPNTISPDPRPVVQQIRSEFPNLDLTVDAQRFEFTHRVAYRLWQQDNKWGQKNAGDNRPTSDDAIGYLRPDVGPGRFEAVDLLGGGVTIQRGCYGVVGAEQNWIQPPPI